MGPSCLPEDQSTPGPYRNDLDPPPRGDQVVGCSAVGLRDNQRQLVEDAGEELNLAGESLEGVGCTLQLVPVHAAVDHRDIHASIAPFHGEFVDHECVWVAPVFAQHLPVQGASYVGLTHGSLEATIAAVEVDAPQRRATKRGVLPPPRRIEIGR